MMRHWSVGASACVAVALACGLHVSPALGQEPPQSATPAAAAKPNIEPGFPASVVQLAERYALKLGQSPQGDKAVELVLEELRLRTKAAGGKLEVALGQLSPEAAAVVNALVRPALAVCNDAIQGPVPREWAERIGGNAQTIATVLRSVGRISCRNLPDTGAVGTGFVAARGALLTNRHVALRFTTPAGALRRDPDNGQEAEVVVDFAGDACKSAPKVYRITRVLYIEPEPGPDVALLAIDDPGQTLPPPLRLQQEPLTDSLAGRRVLVAGYPLEDAREDAGAPRGTLADGLGLKRLMLAELLPGSGVRGTGGEAYLLHDGNAPGLCDGAPVVDLATGAVLGVQFAGVYEKKNWAVPSWRLVQMPQVRLALGLPAEAAAVATKGSAAPASTAPVHVSGRTLGEPGAAGQRNTLKAAPARRLFVEPPGGMPAYAHRKGGPGRPLGGMNAAPGAGSPGNASARFRTQARAGADRPARPEADSQLDDIRALLGETKPAK